MPGPAADERRRGAASEAATRGLPAQAGAHGSAHECETHGIQIEGGSAGRQTGLGHEVRTTARLRCFPHRAHGPAGGLFRPGQALFEDHVGGLGRVACQPSRKDRAPRGSADRRGGGLAALDEGRGRPQGGRGPAVAARQAPGNGPGHARRGPLRERRAASAVAARAPGGRARGALRARRPERPQRCALLGPTAGAHALRVCGRPPSAPAGRRGLRPSRWCGDAARHAGAHARGHRRLRRGAPGGLGGRRPTRSSSSTDGRRWRRGPRTARGRGGRARGRRRCRSRGRHSRRGGGGQRGGEHGGRSAALPLPAAGAGTLLHAGGRLLTAHRRERHPPAAPAARRPARRAERRGRRGHLRR
mmetsp:Transcript_95553/g.274158  ORF Transcript_95553/g.274158 Transcript_95553/m.274158 type:complete len:360 (-) Transcript_95553:687-1766(-)